MTEAPQSTQMRHCVVKLFSVGKSDRCRFTTMEVKLQCGRDSIFSKETDAVINESQVVDVFSDPMVGTLLCFLALFCREHRLQQVFEPVSGW